MDSKKKKFIKLESVDALALFLKKVDRNCFGLGFLNGKSVCGIVFNGSRFNHSCCPNLSFECTHSPTQISFTTTRTIKAGEELTITYLSKQPSNLNYFERQKALEQYGFICCCPKCENEKPK